MKLFHPSTVLGVALLFVALLQVAVGSRFDREARTESPKGVLAGFPLDDAWIHQVYARSLLERGRPEYNPGVAEVGQSSLLWGLLLAPVQALATAVDVPVARATRMFGLVIAVLLALAVAWLVASLPVPGARFGALCGALLVALDPAIAFAAVSGMEPLLFALCLVLALAALVQGRPTLVGLAVGAAILARPEGLLAATVLVPAAAFVQRREESPDSNARSLPRRAGRFARAAAPALVLAAVWGGLCLAVAGRPFPNTWYQKVADVPLSDAVGSGLELLGHAFTTSPFYENYLGYLFLLIGAIALVGRAPRTVWLVLLLFPPLSFVAVAATRAMPDPDAFFWERYLTPMLPLLHVPAAVGFAGAGAVLHDLLRKSRTRPSDETLASPEAHEADEADEGDPAAEASEPHGVDEARTPIELPRRTETLLVPDVVLVVALMLVAFVPFTPAPRRLAESAAEYGRNVRDVDALNVAAGEWLARSGLPRETLVASQDAGAVRWFAPYEVLDLLGLNDHRLVTAGLETGTIGPYLQQRNPDVLVLLDPDPGAVEFALWARAVGMRERARFTVDAYSLFGEPIAKSIVVFAR